MNPLDQFLLDPAEKMFDHLGMMQGDLAPVKRAALGAAIGYAISYGLKPKFAWMADPADASKKIPRPFSATASKDQSQIATWFPSWAIVAAPAIIFGVLI